MASADASALVAAPIPAGVSWARKIAAAVTLAGSGTCALTAHFAASSPSRAPAAQAGAATSRPTIEATTTATCHVNVSQS
ncbi:hypothetical protein [Paraburkholderia kururiensis]|uniref:hypothetical protein n=1 Tax=Paraburkholderia kururiensis TaxID=984307 RepID=UPI000693390D|nr:hypothetical protein [Paraburkholderia kururiensis]